MHIDDGILYFDGEELAIEDIFSKQIDKDIIKLEVSERDYDCNFIIIKHGEKFLDIEYVK
jgi:hypothetical protein